MDRITLGIQSKLICLFIFLVLAYPSIGAAFNVDDAFNQLDQIRTEDLNRQSNIKLLELHIQNLYFLKKQSQDCVDESQSEINALDEQLPNIANNTEISLTSAQEYLVEKRKRTKAKLSRCRLFLLKADEQIQELSNLTQNLREKQIFSKGNDIITDSLKLLYTPHDAWSEIKNLKIQLETYYSDFKLIGMVFATLVILSALCAWLVKKSVNHFITFSGEKTPLQIKLQNILLSIAQHGFGLITSFLCSLIFYWTPLEHNLNFSLTFISGIVLIIILFKCLMEMVFTPPLGNNLFNQIATTDCDKMKKHLNSFFIILMIGYLANVLMLELIPKDVSLLLTTFYHAILLLSFFYIAYHITQLVHFFKRRSKLSLSYHSVILFLFLSLIGILFSGYRDFGLYLIQGVIASSILFFITLIFYSLIFYIIEALMFSKNRVKTQLFKFLSLNSNDIVFEMTILKIVAFLTVWGAFIIHINAIWSLSEFWAIQFQDAITNGFTLMNIRIVPLQLNIGLLSFSIGILLVKIIRGHLHTHINTSMDATQEAYITIMSYVAYGFVLVMSMLIAGIDIKGLALIAGALSVGIGFGLQNIVNNFVSGLVLLLERPVKKGDRIVVGNKEGYVTHVGIRSTRINLVENADVIVPNADLISNKVTNFMYNNKVWRNGISIGVDFGTDSRQVEALLLHAASKVNEVILEGADAPVVYFLKITENALVFQLWYTQENVNRKFEVQSELLHTIDAEFKANGIKVAFPQTDLHIKDCAPIPLAPPKPSEDFS